MRETRIGWYNSRLWRHHSFRRVACAPNHAPPSPTAPMTARRKRLPYSSSSVTGTPRARATLSAPAIQRPVSVPRSGSGCRRAPRGNTRSGNAPPAAASRFISTGIVGQARAQRQALGRRQARRRASPHSQGIPRSRGLLRPSSGKGSRKGGVIHPWCRFRRPPFDDKVEATSAGGGQICPGRRDDTRPGSRGARDRGRPSWRGWNDRGEPHAGLDPTGP